MSLFSKLRHQDRIAMRIADRYGMNYDYKETRRHHLTPLEDWDLLTPENNRLLNQ